MHQSSSCLWEDDKDGTCVRTRLAGDTLMERRPASLVVTRECSCLGPVLLAMQFCQGTCSRVRSCGSCVRACVRAGDGCTGWLVGWLVGWDGRVAVGCCAQAP